MLPWLLVFIVLYSVNGRVVHVPIYKRGHYYGFFDDDGDNNYTSVDHILAEHSRTGLTIGKEVMLVPLTNRLFPDK